LRNRDFKQKRCNCGSGKKFKNCCGKKKSRSDIVVMDMGKPTLINGCRFSRDGRIELLTNGEPVTPVSASIARTYERSSKNDKVVYQAPAKVEPLSWVLTTNLANFDLLLPIDTNTHHKTSESGLTSTAVCMEYERVSSQGAVEFVLKCTWAWEYQHLPPDLAEKTAWVDLIKLLLRNKGEKDLSRLHVGIVTDHDLANHERYNRQEIPLITGTKYFLPSEIELVYASADVVTDSPLNRMIAECDRLSSLGIEKLNLTKT
jgi:hypothetical protein